MHRNARTSTETRGNDYAAKSNFTVNANITVVTGSAALLNESLPNPAPVS